MGVEINISCPNASVGQLPDHLLAQMKNSFPNVIIKAPHACDLDYLLRLCDIGVETIHISNTKKTQEGALSGKSLVDRNLQTIRDLKVLRPSIKVIGGGGIYDLETLLRYEDVGADHFSLSTILFNPLKSRKLIKSYYERSLK
jgi:dihydroorotate dehydrogenase